MTTASRRLAQWILTCAETSGARQALIGDLMEEIARGRSPRWVWRQLLGLCAAALLFHARRQARLTPQLVVLLLASVLLTGISVAPAGRVIETWAGVYLFAGLLSLLADAWQTTHPRVPPAP